MVKDRRGNIENEESSGLKLVPHLFIYLSDALRLYGGKAYCISVESQCNTHDARCSAPHFFSFGLFLANCINTRAVLLFDVHSLNVPCLRETVEVITCLRGMRDGGDVPGLGVESGRDYCLDYERLADAIKSTKSKALSSEVASTISSTKGLPASPEYTHYIDPAWAEWNDGSPKPVSLEFVHKKLVDARHIASVEGHYLNTERIKLPRWSTSPQLLNPAMKPIDPSQCCIGDTVYLVGKMNRQGKPALFIQPLFSPGKSPRSLRTQLTEQRNHQWQTRLNEMYKSEPYKGMSHDALCRELAKKINRDAAPSQTKTISPERIRRVTKDPGKRLPGGSKRR